MPKLDMKSRTVAQAHLSSLSLSLLLSIAAVASGGVIGCSSGKDTPQDGAPVDTRTSAGTGGVTGAGGGGQGGAAGAPASAGGAGGGVVGAGGRGLGGAPGAAGAGGAPVTGAGGEAGRGDAGARDVGGAADASGNAMSFFVSSDTSTTGNLGGLSGADQRCQRLATAVGRGGPTWHAYLSTAAGNARDRIGAGPWFNAHGVVVAANLTALHARTGDPAVFITEHGDMINGQYAGSAAPLQHDILTGTQRDGTIAAGLTCGDWTATTGNSEVGHSDGLGPAMATTGSLSFWNAAHTGQCADTQPGGGAGRIYCFVVN